MGAHISALELKKTGLLRWYDSQLLQFALDIGYRLLPAFNTSTGLPYPRVNLRYGLAGMTKLDQATCTACAGSMILEFAALSRLSGDTVFENVAERAMTSLWDHRHYASNLMGRVIDINNGNWLRRGKHFIFLRAACIKNDALRMSGLLNHKTCYIFLLSMNLELRVLFFHR